ncbi:MAG: AraC family transcriptional regulator [Verrucomicrobia bacterium]|nr:AraC family transcriptional regulator [Verrucomicrobiota bacterium]
MHHPADAPRDTAETKAIFNAPALSLENRAEMRKVFDRAIRQADHQQLPLKIPHEPNSGQSVKGMHYHYRPEFFLQLQGSTTFRFPRESFVLSPDEICVIPANVPHGEQVQAEQGHPFRNLVAGFYNHTISLHFACEVAEGKPDIESIEFFDAPNLDIFLTLCNGLVQSHGMNTPARDAVLKGMTLSLLGLFRNIVETGTDRINCDIGKVYQAKCLVREQFSNPELSVQQIAEKLSCSPDYLSHLFHTETKEKLTHYIQRIRIDSAILALETTALNISEIAYTSGFADPAYFARVFKQHKGNTPQEFRAELEAQRNRREEQPKTVYFDRLDFSPGAPHSGASRPPMPVAP